MKAICLCQPWASLMALGSKSIETRSWASRYRGPLLICASKTKRVWEIEDMLVLPQFQRGLVSLKRNLSVSPVEVNDLPFGVALAVVHVIDVHRTEYVAKQMGKAAHWEDELAFGDYTPGRFAWVTGFLKRILNPFPVRGRLHLFDVPIPVDMQWEETDEAF